MQRKKRRGRRDFTPEFKAATVKLVREGEKGIVQICRDLDLTRSAVDRWVREAEIEEGRGPVGALKKAEHEELVRLRREIEVLREEREILKKATAFFAKERR
jgi:transposase